MESFSTVTRPLLLLIICWVCTQQTSASSVVVQSPGLIKTLVGDSFTLRCTREQKTWYCYSAVAWYKMDTRTGKLNYVNKGKEGVIENNGKTCTWIIPNATLTDSGIYYCVSTYDKIIMAGDGTTVIITERGPLNPSVIMYTPVVYSELDDPQILLQCMVMGAVPSQIHVFWIINEEKCTGWTESGWSGSERSATEFTRAQIWISFEDWIEEAAHIKCVVEYEGKTISKTLHRVEEQSNSCTWLLFGGCSIVVLAIVVTITIILCLHKERKAARVRSISRHHGTDPQCSQQSHGKRDTLRMMDKPSTITEVEYSCLNPDSFIRNPSASVTLELE